MILESLLNCLHPITLLIMSAGICVGLFAGALPGLGAAITVTLMLPFTYGMDPAIALLLLVSAYLGAEYGGSISSITIGIPGTPAAVAMLEDGNSLARKGFPTKAIGYSITGALVGGLFGGICMIFIAKPLATAALNLGAPEYCLIGLLGLAAVVALGSRDVLRSTVSVFIGLLLTTIGVDILTGTPRFIFGRMELMEGIPLVPVLIGMFAVSEVIQMISDGVNKRYVGHSLGYKLDLSMKEIAKVKKPIAIGSIVGTIVGIIPGLGAGPASWFTYSLVKKTSKTPEEFGKGCPEGIAGPEASNCATVGGALIPLLGLGIPGSPTTGIIMGAFLIHGIQPGPNIFSKEPALIYTLFVGFVIAVLLMYILGRLTTPLWAKALAIPNYALILVILVLCMVGSYSDRNLLFDVGIMFIIGILSYFMKKLDFSLPAMILGFILGSMIETNLRRSLLLSAGNFSIFVQRPVSIVLLILILAMVVMSVKSMIKSKQAKAAA